MAMQPPRWGKSVVVSHAHLVSFYKGYPLVPLSYILVAPPGHFCYYFFNLNRLIKFFFRGARLMTWCVEAGVSHSILFFQ